MTLTSREPIKIIASILQTELSLDDEHILLYNQKYSLPTDDGIVVMVGLLAPKLIASKTELDSLGNEVQSVAVAEMIQIDMMSQSSAARLRHYEIYMALNSLYAQGQCERYGVKIARMPVSMADTSGAEDSAMMNRYTTTIIVHAVYVKSKVSTWYDTLQGPDIWINEKP